MCFRVLSFFAACCVALPQEPALSESATLHFYRDVEKGGAHLYKCLFIWMGDRCAIAGERQGTIKIPSGSHTFYSKSPVAALQSNDELQITAEAGKEYFIRGEIIPA